jgi:copper(I)-binding protein
VSSRLRRGALAASALAFSIGSLSACAAGNNAQTLEIKPDNAATALGAIKLQNVVVITQPDAESDGPAVIAATVFNEGSTAQTLDSVSIAGGGTAEITPAKGKGKLTVPAHGSVTLGGPDNASAALTGLGSDVKDGNAQKVTFSFSETGDVSLRAFVVPAESYFSKWGPSELPSASAGTAEPGASSSDEGSASGSPEPGEGTSSANASSSPEDSSTPTDAASASASE